MAEKISWHPPDAALRPASHFECALRRRRKIGFCPPTARWLRVAMLGLSARPSAAPLSSYRKVPRSGERVQEPTTTACGPTLPSPSPAGHGRYQGKSCRQRRCGTTDENHPQETSRAHLLGGSIRACLHSSRHGKMPSGASASRPCWLLPLVPRAD